MAKLKRVMEEMSKEYEKVHEMIIIVYVGSAEGKTRISVERD